MLAPLVGDWHGSEPSPALGDGTVKEGSGNDGRTRGPNSLESMAQALAYHQRTKHHPLLYARGPGHLDWATQPEPFRTFAAAPRTDLPLRADRLTTPFADLYQPDAVASQPLDLAGIAVLFELSMGLSAMETVPGLTLGAALQPLERQPAPDRGLRRRGGPAGPARRHLPLCQQGP